MLEPLRAQPDKTPLIVIPGITGSQLRERATGKLAWGNARAFFFPHDGGYALARPIPAETPDPLELAGPILQVELLGLWKFDIYAGIARLLEANGYRRGDLEAPRAGDTFFFFPYDWRYGNADAVRLLADKLENLRRVRGEETLHVDLLCQSNAARIGRFFVKYGGASLEQAEAGAARPPENIEVRKLILLGTANGGGLRTLRDLNQGRRHVALLGRKLQPETIFTLWSVYEELPFYRNDWFFDEAGQLVDADLADAADWERFGWSIYGKDAAGRLNGSGHSELFGDAAERARFLQEALDRAARLYRVLTTDVDQPGTTRYYSIQSREQKTPERALLRRHHEHWHTDFKPGKRWAARVPGDSHATLASQAALSPQETAALARETAYVDDEHRKIVLNRQARARILEFLAE